MLINWNLNKTGKSSPNNKNKISGKKITGEKSKLFETELQNAVENATQGDNVEIDEILSQLSSVENNLIANPTSANYFEFQSFIKDISFKLMNRAFKVTHFKDTRKKQFEYVRIIDENLKELYGLILGKTGNKNRIAELMGSIRGIILDLSA